MGRRKKDFLYIDEGLEPGYYIECRYSYYGKNGEITWTDWFLDSLGKIVSKEKDEKKFKEAIKEQKEFVSTIDKLMKRKHEYRITEITKDNDPCKELVEMTKKYREIDNKKSKKKVS